MGGTLMIYSNIHELISKKEWKNLMIHFSPRKICLQISFKEAMHLADSLFFDDFRNNDNQQFGLKLLVEISQHFSNEWNSDWKNNVFLGDMYKLLYFDEDAYICCKKAYSSLADPPESLLLRLADCYFNFDPLISETEYEFYVKKAIEKKLTAESALMMRTLFQRRKDEKQREYWNQVYEKLENENIHSEVIIPNVFL